MTKRKQPDLKPGNVYSVPRVKGGFYLIVYITTNGWGNAFGILDGHVEAKRTPSKATARGGQNPVYTGVEHVRNGTWELLANNSELLVLFPPEPELYHEPEESDEFGSYGSAELPSGELRRVDEEEAKRVGLGKLYFQVMHEQQFENYLHTGNPLISQ